MTRQREAAPLSSHALGRDPRLLEAVFDNATVALFVMDDRQQCIYMNAAAEALTGFTLAEVQGKALHNVIHHTRPDGSPYPLEECPIDRAFPENNREQGEEVFVHKDGSFYPVAYTASPIRHAGAVVGTIIEVRDLSKEKEAEAALRRNELRFRTLVTTHAALVWIADADGRLRESPAWEHYTGQPLDEAMGWGWLEAVHADDRAHTREVWQRALASRLLYEVEYRLRSVRGGYRHVRANGAPLLDEMGNVEEWIGTITDIHERKEAQEALRDVNLLLQAALSAGGVVAWMWDVQQNRISGTEELAHFFASDPRDVRRGVPLETFIEAIHEEDRAQVVALVDHTVHTGEGYAADYRVRNAAGEVRWVAARGHVERDAAGRAVRFPGVLVDITERKELERKLAEANDRLEQRVRERTAELEALNRELESFNYSVSHDLRAPLRGIEGFSHLLLNEYAEQLDATGKEYVTRIRKGVLRMAELIDALLDLSRLARVQLEPRVLDLSEMARQIIAALREREPERQVDIAIEAEIEVFGDKALVAIALENLLGNAWKFTRQTAAAKIAVRPYARDGKAGFVVEDNGAGFEMRYAAKLFEPFQRLHSPEEFAGHGIGLATVQRIVHKHGGEIWAEGDPAKGASFYVALPRGPQRSA